MFATRLGRAGCATALRFSSRWASTPINKEPGSNATGQQNPEIKALTTKMLAIRDNPFQELVALLSGKKLNHVVFLNLMRQARQGNKAQVTSALLEYMKKFGPQPAEVHYFEAIIACSRDANINRAMELMEELQRTQLLTARGYNALLIVLARGRKSNQALEVLEKMKEKGINPDGYSYLHAINACLMGNRQDDAWRLWQERNAAGFTISVEETLILIKTAYFQQQHEFVSKWTHSCKHLFNELPDTMYQLTIASAVKADEWQLALELWNAIVAKNGTAPEAETRSVIVGMQKAGRTVELNDIIKRLPQLKATPLQLAEARMAVAATCDEALASIEQFEKQGLQLSLETYRVAASLVRSGSDVAKLIASAQKRRIQMDSWTVAEFMTICLKDLEIGADSDKPPVIQLLEYNKFSGHRHPAPYNIVMRTASRKPQTAALALGVYDTMVQHELIPTPGVLHCAVLACKLLSNWPAAAAVLQQAKDRGVTPQVDTLGILAELCYDTGEVDQAMQLEQELEMLGVSPTSHLRVARAQGLMRVGRVEDGLASLEEYIESGGALSPHIIGGLIRAVPQIRESGASLYPLWNFLIAHNNPPTTRMGQEMLNEVVESRNDELAAAILADIERLKIKLTPSAMVVAALLLVEQQGTAAGLRFLATQRQPDATQAYGLLVDMALAVGNYVAAKEILVAMKTLGAPGSAGVVISILALPCTVDQAVELWRCASNRSLSPLQTRVLTRSFLRCLAPKAEMLTVDQLRCVQEAFVAMQKIQDTEKTQSIHNELALFSEIALKASPAAVQQASLRPPVFGKPAGGS